MIRKLKFAELSKGDEDDPDEEMGGSPVPRPSSPTPPPPGVRLDKPRSTNEGGE